MRNTWQRAIPRDLFNEANLLVCFGRISLLCHDGKVPGFHCEGPEGYEAFGVEFDQDNNALTLSNVKLTSDATGVTVELGVWYNSREKWPMFAYEDLVSVFDDEGQLTDEFKSLLARM